MDPFLIFWIAGICLLLAVAWLIRLRRSRAFKAFAARRGFRYLGSALPASLTLTGTTFERVTQISNSMDGHIGSLHIAIFDCRIGSGKASWRRTVIAAQTTGPVFPVSGLEMTVNTAFDLTSEHSGAWTLLYRPWKTTFFGLGPTPIPQLGVILDTIRG